MPLRLRGALLALSIAAMATQVSGASAAPEMAGARPVPAAASAAAALSDEHAQLTGLASLLRGPQVSGSGALLVAGLLGVWAIGHRRVSAAGSRSLDPQGLRRRRR
jgi:hypothetical protein